MSGDGAAVGDEESPITDEEMAALVSLLHAGWAVTFEPCTAQAGSDPGATTVVVRRSSITVSSDQRDQSRIDRTILANRSTAGQAVQQAAWEALRSVW